MSARPNESVGRAPTWRVLGWEAELVWSAWHGTFAASVPRLPGCVAHGASRTEALRALASAIQRWGDSGSPN